MANIVTVAEVRTLTGIPSDLLSDTSITEKITLSQEKALDYFNVYITPTLVTEIKDGNNKYQIMINKPYILKLVSLKTKTSTISLENTNINYRSGIITMDSTSAPSLFPANINNIKIKYLSAFMSKTDTVTETTAATTAGTSVSISVDSESGFANDDWVIVEGLDNHFEVAKVTSTSSGTIVVDELLQTHENESLITKVQTHPLLKQFILYESAVAAGIDVIGASYTFNTSYTLEGVAVTKGVPYPHFEKNVNENIKQRDILRNQIMNKLNSIA